MADTVTESSINAEEEYRDAAALRRLCQQFEKLLEIPGRLYAGAEKLALVERRLAAQEAREADGAARIVQQDAEVERARESLMGGVRRDVEQERETLVALQADVAALRPEVEGLRAERAALLADIKRLSTAKANLEPVGV